MLPKGFCGVTLSYIILRNTHTYTNIYIYNIYVMYVVYIFSRHCFKINDKLSYNFPKVLCVMFNSQAKAWNLYSLYMV